MDPSAVSLLDLPRPFLSQLLNELDDFDAAQSLIGVSKSAFQLVFELKPAALVLWGSSPATARRLQQLLPLGGLRALLLPDSDENVDLPKPLQLPGLKTAVLNYRCDTAAVGSLHASLQQVHISPRLILDQLQHPHKMLAHTAPPAVQCNSAHTHAWQLPGQHTPMRILLLLLSCLVSRHFSCRFPALDRLVSSAHASTLDSIIIRGWQLQGDYTLRLSTFLQQLQELSSLQHLALTLPCIGAAAAALGKLQHLRSLRMCTDVSHDSEVSSML